MQDNLDEYYYFSTYLKRKFTFLEDLNNFVMKSCLNAKTMNL